MLQDPASCAGYSESYGSSAHGSAALSQTTHMGGDEVSTVALPTVGDAEILMALIGGVVRTVLSTKPDVHLVAPSHLKRRQKINHT